MEVGKINKKICDRGKNAFKLYNWMAIFYGLSEMYLTFQD